MKKGSHAELPFLSKSIIYLYCIMIVLKIQGILNNLKRLRGGQAQYEGLREGRTYWVKGNPVTENTPAEFKYMRVDEIIRYSKDYKELLPSVRASFFTVRIDFDFALSLPDMENRVYYKRDCYQRTKDNLNSHGIFLFFDYMITTREITDITVSFDKFCQVPYHSESDINQIVSMLHEYKA